MVSRPLFNASVTPSSSYTVGYGPERGKRKSHPVNRVAFPFKEVFKESIVMECCEKERELFIYSLRATS